MTNKNKAAVAVIGGILVVLSVLAYFYVDLAKVNRERVNASVVVYGSTAERWTAFRQGAEQAASDLDATVNFVTMEENDREEQERLMSGELENGAQGLAVALADTRAQAAEYVTATSGAVPMVLVESEIYGNASLPCVAANAYEMGKELARQALEDAPEDASIHMVWMGENRQSQKDRMAGFKDACREAGRQVQESLYPNQEAMRQVLKGDGTYVLAAIDDLTLETAVNVIGGKQENISLYGIGSSAQIVYALDQGLVKGIVFQNEFNMGYEAVDILVQKIRKGGAEEPMEIDFHHATGETLHEPEHERLLYPIIQ